MSRGLEKDCNRGILGLISFTFVQAKCKF